MQAQDRIETTASERYCTKCDRAGVYTFEGTNYCAEHMIERLREVLGARTELLDTNIATCRRNHATITELQHERNALIEQLREAQEGLHDTLCTLRASRIRIANLYEDLGFAYHHLAGDH